MRCDLIVFECCASFVDMSLTDHRKQALDAVKCRFEDISFQAVSTIEVSVRGT